jgi:predicted RNA-binding protein with PIN domain
MTMLAQWLIIDGNNLLHSAPEFAARVRSNFALARHDLVRRLEELLGLMAPRITVVFDGTIGGRQTGFESSAVEVIFTSADVSADATIERLAAEAGNPQSVVVVSSDRLERYTVESSGVRSLSCRSFVEEMARVQGELHRRLQQTRRQPGTRGTLGDFFR